MSTSTLRLAPQQDGYLLDEQFYPGFADRPTMSMSQRHRIARWALKLAPADVTDEQRALLEDVSSRVPSEQRLRSERRSDMLASPVVRALWDTLGAGEQALVLNPDEQLGDGVRFPLSVGQLAQLVRMDKQTVRRWGDTQLLPSTKNAQGHREYGAAAAVIAFSLNGSKQNDREYYGDLLRSTRPLTALRRCVALATYFAFAGHTTTRIDEATRELEGLSEQVRSLAEAFEKAVQTIRDQPEGTHPFADAVEFDLHELGAIVRLADPGPGVEQQRAATAGS